MKKDGLVRLAVASVLLLTTVPWWARDLPTLAGLPGWVVAALALSVAYAVTVGLLLQVFWDDPGENPATSTEAKRNPPS